MKLSFTFLTSEKNGTFLFLKVCSVTYPPNLVHQLNVIIVELPALTKNGVLEYGARFAGYRQT